MLSVYGRSRAVVLFLVLVLAGCGDGGTVIEGDPPFPELDGSPGDGGTSTTSDSAAMGGGDGDFFEPRHAGATIEDGGVEALPEPTQIFATNPFVHTAHDPFSTFAADVDSASYDIFRRDAEHGNRPPSSHVRAEDFVNYFAYDYEAPAHDSSVPFAISLEAAPSLLGGGTYTLRVGIQGKEQPPFEKKPANIVFLVDVSGSMQAPDKMPLAQRVLARALDILEPTDTVSIVTYAGDTQVRLEPTAVDSAATIRGVIESLNAAGGTNGASGIQLAYQQARAGFIEGGINHVVLCTDGDFNLGVTGTAELVDLITEERMTGVTLTALGFGRDNLNDEMMEKVSNAGNGSYSVITDEAHAERYAEDKLLSTIVLIAKDVKLQVEWNPELVEAYRLIGYENRAIADDDFRDDLVDAGEIGSGHRVTALYEVVLTGSDVPVVENAPEALGGEPVAGAREIGAAELVRVKVRYKAPLARESDRASEVVQALLPSELRESFEDASDDARFAMAVAAWAELLKDSPFVTSSVLGALEDVLSDQAARDADRDELLMLFQNVR